MFEYDVVSKSFAAIDVNLRMDGGRYYWSHYTGWTDQKNNTLQQPPEGFDPQWFEPAALIVP